MRSKLHMSAEALCADVCVLQDDLMDSPEVETMLKDAKHLKVTSTWHADTIWQSCSQSSNPFMRTDSSA